jgi:hypothetical protein
MALQEIGPVVAYRRAVGLGVKYWEIIADNLKKAGWSLGYDSALDCEGRTIWIVDAHRGDGKRFIVRADEIGHGFLVGNGKRPIPAGKPKRAR